MIDAICAYVAPAGIVFTPDLITRSILLSTRYLLKETALSIMPSLYRICATWSDPRPPGIVTDLVVVLMLCPDWAVAAVCVDESVAALELSVEEAVDAVEEAADADVADDSDAVDADAEAEDAVIFEESPKAADSATFTEVPVLAAAVAVSFVEDNEALLTSFEASEVEPSPFFSSSANL